MNIQSIWRQSTFLFILVSLIITSSYAQDKDKQDKYLIEAEAFHKGTDGKKNVIIVDVRTPGEFEESRIEGAKNIDFKNQNFLEEIGKLDKSKKYYIYCRSGRRSANSRNLMNEAGIRKVYDLKGGIIAWKKAEYPIK